MDNINDNNDAYSKIKKAVSTKLSKKNKSGQRKIVFMSLRPHIIKLYSDGFNTSEIYEGLVALGKIDYTYSHFLTFVKNYIVDTGIKLPEKPNFNPTTNPPVLNNQENTNSPEKQKKQEKHTSTSEKVFQLSNSLDEFI